MDDYIKRSDALDAFTYEQGDRIPDVGSHGEQNEIWVRDVKAKLRSIRAADVVEVVRCRECKYFRLWGGYDKRHYCSNNKGIAGIVASTDFCSYGER